MANFQVRYGCTLVETDVNSDSVFDEGTTLTINASSGKWEPTTTADVQYRLVYTGYPSTRPDVLTVCKVKAVMGPGIIETDVVTGTLDYGTEVVAASGMLCAETTDVSDSVIGYVVGKNGSSRTIQLY